MSFSRRMKLNQEPDHLAYFYLDYLHDLENACVANNWRLPSYLIEPSDGKFLSNLVFASKSFELSLKGGLENGLREARESAAA
ncbi:hypothetical protein CASFOL_041015 [Castilleja foliolosa]|uniref:Uncharacterized protein n=1 Tax=Castilleja foliolosa TaxID=1961234 RepID=A0ABD3BDM3_9LAMI